MLIKKIFGTCLTGTTVLAASIVLVSLPSPGQSKKFMCLNDHDSVPTTYANTSEGAKPFIKWTSKHFSQSSYTPMKRCQKVTDKLNQFYAAGKLDYITTGWVNGQPVFCATQACSQATVLLTLKPGQEPNQALEEMKAVRAGSSGPTYQSSGTGGSSVVLNIEQYLDEAPVETPDSTVNSSSLDAQPKTNPNSQELF